MNKPLTIECEVHFERRDRGRKEMKPWAEPIRPAPKPGRVPRVARLLALAHRFHCLLRDRVLQNCVEIARLGHVTPARISQVMSLLFLAPDIQEPILFWPRITQGRDPIRLADLLPIAQELDWSRQRTLWATLLAARGLPNAESKDGRPRRLPGATAPL